MTKKKSFMGSLYGEDKKGTIPLATKPVVGNATKSGNVWKSEKERKKRG